MSWVVRGACWCTALWIDIPDNLLIWRQAAHPVCNVPIHLREHRSEDYQSYELFVGQLHRAARNHYSAASKISRYDQVQNLCTEISSGFFVTK